MNANLRINYKRKTVSELMDERVRRKSVMPPTQTNKVEVSEMK